MTMQAKQASASGVRANNDGEAARAVFAVGGLLAAFGVASCCALPVVLSLLGISAASLVGIGYLSALYQKELFYVAAGCLGVAVFLVIRKRRIRACAAGGGRSLSLLDWSSMFAILLAVGFLALTLWIEFPL